MLRCANELAAFLLSRRPSYTSEVLRLRAGHAGLVRLDAIAADQLVGGLLFSAAEMLARENEGPLEFYLEVGVEGLRSRGEELPAFVGSMAAFFVRVIEEVVRTFPLEHTDEVISWLQRFCGAYLGGSVEVWNRQQAAN